MIPVRKTVEISDGVRVDLLFTPRISIYQEVYGPLPELLLEESETLRVMERYADIFFFAALNAWELDGRGTVDDFPHKRGDFHGWMSADPKGFGEAVKFAVSALTGKTAKELAAEEEKRRQNTQKSQETAKTDEVKKKKSWLYRLIHPSRSSS